MKQAPAQTPQAAPPPPQPEAPPLQPAAPDYQPRGRLLLFCGHGKGKTCAALGLVFRALGRSFAVAVVCFNEPVFQAGERLFAQALPQLNYLVAGEAMRGTLPSIDAAGQSALAMGDAWLRARACIESGTHRLVVLDDLLGAIDAGYVGLHDVLHTLTHRPAHVHVVVTGMPAPPEFLAAADVITEMRGHATPNMGGGEQLALGIDF